MNAPTHVLLIQILNALPDDPTLGPVLAVGLQVVAHEMAAPEPTPLYVLGEDPLDSAEEALKVAWLHVLRTALQFHGSGVTPPQSVKEALALTAKALLTLQGGAVDPQ